MAKYENPAELDYRNGGDTVDDFAQKYMQTVDYIIKALNDLRTPTGNSAGVEPEPYMWRIADNKLYIRNGDNTDYVLLGEISPNFGFRQSVNDRFLTTADLEGEGAVVTRNEAGKVEGDITGSPGKIAGKTIDVTPSADNDVIAYDAAQQKWVKKTLNDYLKKQGDAGWDEMVDEVADQVIEDITPIIFNFWYLDDDGYLVPLVGSTEGGLPSIHGMVGDYEQITARSVDVAGNLSATGNVTAGMVTTPQANVTTLTANAVTANSASVTEISAGKVTADDVITKGPIVDVRAFGAKGDGVTDDTAAFESAISAAENNTLFIPNGNYKINSTLIANKAKSVVNNGNYTGVEPIYPIGENLSKMALNLTPEIKIKYPSAAEPTSTVSYFCESVGYNPVTDHVLLVFAGYTIATGANDQPGKVVEMTADYQTVINSATIDVGHGNGCCYCSKDQKWYIATGTGIISLNSDLSINSTHLTGSGWTVEYSSDKNVFYVQVGDTGTENSAKMNIYSYNWELLSQTTLERVKNRYKTGYLSSQDATLINGDYVFLYYGAQDISLTTYDMLTGRIKEHAIFDNIAGREPEGIYVRQNQLYIVSVESNLLIYKCPLNNVANISPYRLYVPGEQITYFGVITGCFTSGGTELWFTIPSISIRNGVRYTIDLGQETVLIVRQGGNYIINANGVVLSNEYKVESVSYSYNGLGVTRSFKLMKQDGTVFTNAVNNDVCAIYAKFNLAVY